MNIDIIKNRKKVIIGLILLVIIGIPLTVLVARKQQEIRSRASGSGTVQFVLSPQTATKNLGETFSVDVNIDAGAFSLSGLDTNINIDKNAIEFVSFTPSTFDTVINNSYSPTTGVLRITVVNAENPSSTGTVKVGTLTLKAKAVGTGAVSVASDAQVVASGQETQIPLDASINGSYTVASPTPTSTPTPTPAPTGTITANPQSCTVPWNETSCITTVSWNSQNASNVSVGISGPGSWQNGSSGSRATGVATGQTTFTLYSGGAELGRVTVTGNKQPAPTSTPTPTPRPTNTPTPTPAPVIGDYDGNRTVDITDFNIWKNEFLGISSTKRSDANKDGKIDLIDYNIWRNHYH